MLFPHIINASHLSEKKKRKHEPVCFLKRLKLCCPFQAYFPKVTAILHDWRMDLCGLYPGTKYFVRIRAQDLRAVKHWSSWSGFAEATTAEAGEEQIVRSSEVRVYKENKERHSDNLRVCLYLSAPVVAPELWRHIQPVDRSGQRRITLLWKVNSYFNQCTS